MKVKDVTNYLETIAPLQLQEEYDNAGLIIGNGDDQIKGVLICLDITDEVLNEAVNTNCNLIIAHHPLIFTGLKKINDSSYPSSCVYKAIQHAISIYAIHTNLDNVSHGVNGKIAEILNLNGRQILKPLNNLLKLAFYVPNDHLEKVRNAVFEAGAGHIGLYSNCSFSSAGLGTFLPHDGTSPFSGKLNELSIEKEQKLETILPNFKLNEVIAAMKLSHPYEEVAYDVYPMLNSSNYGSGLIGELENDMSEIEFLTQLKSKFHVSSIRHTQLLNKKVKRVAVCGGSGSFLLPNAISKKADIFITSDFKYHQFFDANNQILIADIGHYESEQFTIDLIGDILMKKFTNFAIRLTSVNTNPINYF